MVENLKRALLWLVVFAVGLAPMLVYWMAGLIGQAFRRKRSGPYRKGEARSHTEYGPQRYCAKLARWRRTISVVAPTSARMGR